MAESKVRDVRSLLRDRAELVVLVVGLLLVTGWSVLSDRPAPFGIYALGAVGGAGLALHAIGLVLVYRANRVINFAQLQMGAVAGQLFLALVHERSFVRGIASACPPCVPKVETVGELVDRTAGQPAFALQGAATPEVLALRIDDPRAIDILPANLDPGQLAIRLAPRWLVDLNYWLSLAVSVAVAASLVLVVYLLVIKRFQHAPRLVLTVVTLVAGAFARFLGARIIGWLFRPAPGSQLSSDPIPLPIGARITIDGAVFAASDLATVLLALLAGVGLVVYLRRSSIGIVLRGAAENPQRAQSLGVNVDAVTSRVWVIAGTLSALAAMLTVAKVGGAGVEGYDTMVRALAATVVGGLVGLPLAVAGAVAIGVVDQVVLWVTSSQALVAGLLVVLVVGLLLAQRSRSSRAEVEASGSWVASRELRPIPAELRSLPSVRTTIGVVVALGLLWVLAFPWVMSPGQTQVGSSTMLYAIVGLSLLVLTGWAGQISLAQMALAGIGAWTTAVVDLPFLMAVPMAATVGAMVAALVGLPALRLRGQFLAIATLALSLAVSSIVLGNRYLGSLLPVSVERPALLGVDFDDERAFYYLVLVLLAAACAAVSGLRRSRTARALIAAKDNEQAAQQLGINLVRARVVAFATSGFFAALAGAVLVYAQRGLQPTTFAPEASVRIFSMTLLGGLGSIAGPVAGALYLGLLELLGGSPLAVLADLLGNPAIGLLLLLLFLPGGVIQLLWTVRDAWLRRVAARFRIVVPSLIADEARSEAAVPMAPKLRPTGGELLIPVRYRMDDQWMVQAEREAIVRGG